MGEDVLDQLQVALQLPGRCWLLAAGRSRGTDSNSNPSGSSDFGDFVSSIISHWSGFQPINDFAAANQGRP